MDVKPIDNEALILKDTEKHVDIPLQSVRFVAYAFFEACRIRDFLKQLVMINCSSVCFFEGCRHAFAVSAVCCLCDF